MKITRIKSPKFRVGRYILNEYKLRQLLLEVCKGEKPSNLKIKDMQGNVIPILEDGTLSATPYGFDINSNITLEKIKFKRLNSKK